MKDLIPIKGAADLPTSPVPADYTTMPGTDGPGAPSGPLRIKRFLVFLKRFWWLPVLTLILGLGAGVAFVLWAPPIFISKGSMWETEKLRLPDSGGFTGDLQNYYGTQMELLQSDMLQQLAIARLQASGLNRVARDPEGKPLEVKVTARQAPKSTVFFVQAASGNAAYSQAFLDALMGEYLAYKKNVRKEVAGTTLGSVALALKRLEIELKESQEAFTVFQRSNNLAMLEQEATISGGYLIQLKTQLSDLELESRLLEATAIAQEVQGSTNSSGYLPEPVQSGKSGQSSMATTERQAAFKELELLKAQREKLSKYLKPKHPKIAKLDSDIERGYKIAELFRNQSHEQLVAARQSVSMRLENVKASIKEWETKVIGFKSLIAEAERLKFTVSRSQSLFDRVDLMLRNVNIAREIDQEPLAVLEPAAPAKRSYKNELTALGLAGVAGLAAGLGLILLIGIRDDRFINLSEVTDKFGDSIIGQVPEMRALRKQKNPALLQESNEPHALAESYRNLRSALLFFPLEAQRPKVLLITSAVPNEGKSTIAANLARTFAQGGSRVLLVDADLRRGALHTTLGLQREPGLANLLLNESGDPARYFQEVPFQDVQKETPTSDLRSLASDLRPPTSDLRSPSSDLRPPTSDLRSSSPGSLHLLARGGHVKNPGDAFLSRDLGQVIALWREQFDFVIIDTCPVFAADDAAALAPKVDGTLLVVRRGFSRAAVTREALDVLLQRQANVLGLIYNRADATSHSYYYYKHEEYAQAENKG